MGELGACAPTLFRLGGGQWFHKILDAYRAIHHNAHTSLSVRRIRMSMIHVDVVFCSVGTRGTVGDGESLNVQIVGAE